jgi:hypothetical protein
MRFATLIAVTAISVVSTFATAEAAPAGIPTRALDLELNQADVKNVYRLLADVAERQIVLDPCVHGAVDLKMKNTPIPIVLDALALKLNLAYEERENGVIGVVCKDPDAGDDSAKDAARVNIAEKNVPLPDALAHLATAAKLDGVDYRATAKPNVDITLNKVRLGTAVRALSDTSGVKVSVQKNRLIVTD